MLELLGAVFRALELVAVRVGGLRVAESDVGSLKSVVLKALELVAVRVGKPRDVEDDVGSIWSVIFVLVFPNSGYIVL